MITVRQAIICILHCENRGGEKLLKTLLVEAYNNLDSDKKAQEEMIAKVEEVSPTSILGSEWRRSQWSVHRDKKSGTILDQNMPNRNARKFVDNFPKLTLICIEDDARREKWDDAVASWKAVMEMGRRKEDFTSEDADEFQRECDDFFEKWVDLTDDKGLSNYFHMVGSGHLTYYIREHKSLYQFSQQGWEGLNAMIKSFFFKRTQRGGHGGKANVRNSKVAPIARWMQRTIFWKSGLEKELFGDD